MTGIDGPRIKPSFPQPQDAVTEGQEVAELEYDGDERNNEGGLRDDASDLEATLDTPPALAMPRAKSNPQDMVRG